MEDRLTDGPCVNRQVFSPKSHATLHVSAGLWVILSAAKENIILSQFLSSQCNMHLSSRVSSSTIHLQNGYRGKVISKILKFSQKDFFSNSQVSVPTVKNMCHMSLHILHVSFCLYNNITCNCARGEIFRNTVTRVQSVNPRWLQHTGEKSMHIMQYPVYARRSWIANIRFEQNKITILSYYIWVLTSCSLKVDTKFGLYYAWSVQ